MEPYYRPENLMSIVPIIIKEIQAVQLLQSTQELIFKKNHQKDEKENDLCSSIYFTIMF